MKNIKVIILAILLLYSPSVYFFSQEKTYKNIKTTINLSKVTKKKSHCELYTDEDKAKGYIKYLIANSLLEIDKNSYYSTTLIDKHKKWIVLLFLSEKSEEGIVTDALDCPLKYLFMLDKDTGKISNFYTVF